MTARGLLRPAVPLAVMTVALAAPAAASAHVAGTETSTASVPPSTYIHTGSGNS